VQSVHRPIETGPFYALKVVPVDLASAGGLRCDENGGVLDAEGRWNALIPQPSIMPRAFRLVRKYFEPAAASPSSAAASLSRGAWRSIWAASSRTAGPAMDRQPITGPVVR